MKIGRFPAPIIAAALLTLVSFGSNCALPSVADNSAADAKELSFKDYYRTRDASIKELEQEADTAAQQNRYVEASAKYLAAAYDPYVAGNFEMARLDLDKAFLMAAKAPVAEQKQMLQYVSSMISASRNQQSLDVYKYFSQQRLKLLQKQPGSTAQERFQEVATLALSCSQHKRYKEAESLLLETLADLQSMKPVSNAVGSCESILARVYDEGGDVQNAKLHYAKWAQIEKDSNNEDRYERALEDYTGFLVGRKFPKSVVVPVAEEFLKVSAHSRWRDRMPFGTIARKLVEIDPDEASKYYRAAFESEKQATQLAMNTGYGNTISEWAQSLYKQGKTAEAIAVLEEGMAFCRTVKWPDALERDMPIMLDRYEEYLRALNRTAEATEARAQYKKEMVARKEGAKQERERWVDWALKAPTATPLDKVTALLERGYSYLDGNRCEDGIKLVEEATNVYEKAADTNDSPLMYRDFVDIIRRFSKCGHPDEGKAIALRVVRARMVKGYPDPDEGRTFVCTMGCGRLPAETFDELLPGNDSSRHGSDAEENRTLKRLLSDAKATGKATNVAYVLDRAIGSRPFDEERARLQEDMDTWKAKEQKPALLFASMMRTADICLYLNQFEKALGKCKSAIELAKKSDAPDGTCSFPSSGALASIGNSFMNKDKLDIGANLHMAAYERSLHERVDNEATYAIRDVQNVAKRYRELNDPKSADALIEQAIQITKSERGEDSTLMRAWLIKASAYYVANGEKDKAKEVTNEFIASINKPGMSIARSTADEMDKHAKFLNENGYKDEAKKIEERLEVFNAQQCGAH